MTRTLAAVALLVRDYDEAIEYFTRALRFTLVEDTPMGGAKRWVLVAPGGVGAAQLLLARAATDEQAAFVGNQSGGRVFLFVHTTDFQGDYDHMLSHNVKFTETPRLESYGRVVVFQDLYGDKWDLIESPVRPGPDGHGTR